MGTALQLVMSEVHAGPALFFQNDTPSLGLGGGEGCVSSLCSSQSLAALYMAYRCRDGGPCSLYSNLSSGLLIQHNKQMSSGPHT